MMARMLNGRNASVVLKNLGKHLIRKIENQKSIEWTVTSVLGAGMLASVFACGGEVALQAQPTHIAHKAPLLLIVFDAVDASRVSHLGYERKTTPNLDALAEQGVTFSNAFTPAPYTLAAIPSLLTGRLPVTWLSAFSMASPSADTISFIIKGRYNFPPLATADVSTSICIGVTRLYP